MSIFQATHSMVLCYKSQLTETGWVSVLGPVSHGSGRQAELWGTKEPSESSGRKAPFEGAMSYGGTDARAKSLHLYFGHAVRHLWA